MALDDEDALGRARVPLAAESSDDAYVASVFGPILEAGSDVSSLYRALAVAPAMLRAWRGIAQVLLHDCTSPARVRELMILRVAQLLECQYQWDHHLARARAAGVTDTQIDALVDWVTADAFAADERAVLAMTDESTRGAAVSDGVHAELTRHFEAPQIVELALTVGFYNCVCRVVGTLYDSADALS